MILMAPCIIDFIGANALLGPVGGGRSPGHSWALKGHRAKQCIRPYEIYYAQGHKNHRSINIYYVKVNEVNPGPILLCEAHTVVL
jgi:hypothetical protein